jgi:disulfide bond formation protein DsbB
MLTVENVNLGLTWLTVLGQVVSVVLLILLVSNHFLRLDFKILKFVEKYTLQLSLIVISIAVLGSLFYSEIAQYNPCKLCWLQRIFIYPQVVVLGLALILKDKKAVAYSLALSCFAFIIATYHYLGQTGVVDLTSCEVVGYSASCSERFVLQLGYITIPVMAMTAMGMVIVFSLVHLFNKKHLIK